MTRYRYQVEDDEEERVTKSWTESCLPAMNPWESSCFSFISKYTIHITTVEMFCVTLTPLNVYVQHAKIITLTEELSPEHL